MKITARAGSRVTSELEAAKTKVWGGGFTVVRRMGWVDANS